MFRQQYKFDERRRESAKVMQKYPDRLPVVCERHAACKNVPDVDRKKYLVPRDLTAGQFVYVLRKRVSVAPTQAIFLSTESGQIPPSDQRMHQLYSAHRNEDGFLYLRYSGENVFGCSYVYSI